MKNWKIRLVLFFMSSLFIACNVVEAPEYKYMEEVTVKRVGLNNITVVGYAVFNNPNIIDLKVKKVDIEVYTDSIYLGKATSPLFEVKAEKEFLVPLNLSFSPKKILEQKGGLKGVFQMLDKQFPLTYKGFLTLEVLGIEYDYEIDQTEMIDFKEQGKNKED